MQVITAFILAAFVGYIGAWYLGVGGIEGNFPLLLFLASIITGIYWFLDIFYFAPRRKQAALVFEAAQEQRNQELRTKGLQLQEDHSSEMQKTKERLLMQPWWMDWTAGLFPVILIVFLFRSFLFEPFKIPSGSMIPTLFIGDLILVNKFTYGIRLPILNTKIINVNEPQRGDVMVFRYPPKPSVDYIKRVIGIPGDEVSYLNKRLTVNGQTIETNALPDFLDENVMRYFPHYEEKVISNSNNTNQKKHGILNDKERPAFIAATDHFAFRENCNYTIEGVTCKVPAGHYFMMGDNRDNSLDSRYWGFVPDANIVGKANFIWMNFKHWNRFGFFD